MPQGSVLCSLFFLVYLLPLRKVINQYALNRHGLSWDSTLQTVKCKKHYNAHPSSYIMEECKASVRTWMTVNKLKLNDSKTDIMMVASSHNQCRLTNTHLKTGEVIFKPRHTVKNLGAALNTILSMEAQVRSVVWNMHFNIRRISKVKRHLTQEAFAKVTNATVISQKHANNNNGNYFSVNNEYADFVE